MGKRFDLEIEWMDGKKETFYIGGCNATTVKEGVLFLWLKIGEFYPVELVGSFPLANIRKYGKVNK